MTTYNKKLFIQATNIHSGGGALLLADFIRSIGSDVDVYVLLCHKMKIPFTINSNIKIKVIPSTLHQRLFAELWLLKNVNEGDKVICFGNLPPLFRLRGNVIVLLQNRFLVDLPSVKLNLKNNLKLRIERLWFQKCVCNVQEYIVQTTSMLSLLRLVVGDSKPIHIFPFSLNLEKIKRNLNYDVPRLIAGFNFIYIASGERHKNHRKLLEAWIVLANEGFYPTLHLTIGSEWPKLSNEIAVLKSNHGLMIINHGALSPDALLNLYERSDALVYPSLFESFGLPLVEAAGFGIPVIASELDYVRDVIEPTYTFNPNSSLSIARALKRFMGLKESVHINFNSDDFMNFIINSRDLDG